MRIVLIVRGFPVASETFIVDLFERLLARGYDVRVVRSIASDAGWAFFDRLFRSGARDRVRRAWPMHPLPLAVLLVPLAIVRCLANAPVRTLRYLLRGWGAFGPKVVWKLYRDAELVILGPGAVHFQFGSLAIGREDIGDLLGCAVITSFQGADINFGGLEMVGYYDGVWRSADGIHFASEDLRRRATRRGFTPDGRDVVINPSVDVTRFSPQPRAARGSRPLRVLSVGRLHWKKGYEYALAAIARLRVVGVDVEYRIVGDGGYRDAIESTARQLGIEDRVHLLGVTPADGVRDEMQNADVLLHSAVSEGFCLVALEAQAMELPVVASDADGLPDNVRDGETGYVVPRRDPHALAEKLALLAADDDLRRRLGAAGRRRATDHFAPETQVDAYERLYRDAVARRAAADTPAAMDTGRG
jgi:colanic acid/amylovoran biosynthesis glycosyltransferase